MFIAGVSRLAGSTAGLVLLSGCGVLPPSSPRARVSHVGILTGVPKGGLQTEAFRRELPKYGWVEGQNVVVEAKWGEGRIDEFESRLPEQARDLVHQARTVAKDAQQQVRSLYSAA